MRNRKYKDLIASSSAGVLNVLLTTPLSVISNTVIAAQKSKNIQLSIFGAAKRIYEQNGIMGFYKGLIISLILVINPTINFSLKTVFSRLLKSSLIRKSKQRCSQLYKRRSIQVRVYVGHFPHYHH